MLTCGDLEKLVTLKKLRYLTEDKGLGNIIRWFLAPETERLAPWVHGGELLIVSGAICQRSGFHLYHWWIYRMPWPELLYCRIADQIEKMP